MSESQSNSNSQHHDASDQQIQALKHEIELLRLKNEMLEKSLSEKESWHLERGEHIKRLIKEKEGIEAHLQKWMLQMSVSKDDETQDSWARRKGDIHQTSNRVIEPQAQSLTNNEKLILEEDKPVKSKTVVVDKQPSPQPVSENIDKSDQNKILPEKSLQKVSVNTTVVPESHPTPWKKVLFVLTAFFLALCTVIPNKLSDFFILQEVYQYQSLIESPPASDKVKLVLITEQDLKSFGRWPWTRDTMATFHEYLEFCNVKTIVYDIMFVEPTDQIYDEAFAEILDIQNKNNVILAAAVQEEFLHPVTLHTDPFDLAAIENGSEGFILPYKPFFHPNKVGAVNTNTTDRQRLVPIFFNVEGSYIPNLSLLAVLNYGEIDQRMFQYHHGRHLNIKAWENGEDRVIPLYNKNEFLAVPYDDINEFETFSITELAGYLSENKKIESLKDSLVFIGLHDQVSDIHQNARGKAVPGVLFHAGIASNIINGDFIYPVDQNQLWICLISAVLLSIFLGWFCQRVYLLKWMTLQRMVMILIPVGITSYLVFSNYMDGGIWRSLVFFNLELAFLLPIAVLKWQTAPISIRYPEAVDLSQQKEIQYSLLTQAPRPMALAYERHLQVSSDKTQHTSTVFEERVVRFLGMMHLAVLYRSGCKVDQSFLQVIKNDTHSLQRPLAAGTCIGFTVYARKALKAFDDFRFFDQVAPKAFRETFLKERQAGGHYDLGNKSKGPIAFESWLTEYQRKMNFKMFVYLGHENIDERDYLVYEFLGGCHRLGKQMIQSETRLEINHIYLLNRDGVLLDLFPFLIYRPYEQTQAKEILEFYQIKSENKVLYKSLNGSETIELEDMGFNEILKSWEKQAFIKKPLPQLMALQRVLDDELRPWSVGDQVLEEWVIDRVIMKQNGVYWYHATSLSGDRPYKSCLLSFYLKNSESYDGLDDVKNRLSKKLDTSYVLKPFLTTESNRGFWMLYPDVQFFKTRQEFIQVKDELLSILNKFHKEVGPHHLLSKFSFVKIFDKGKTKLLMTPGSEFKTHGQTGVNLQRMLDKYKQREIKLLEELCN